MFVEFVYPIVSAVPDWIVTTAEEDQFPKSSERRVGLGLGKFSKPLRTKRCVLSKLVRPHLLRGEFWSPRVSAFPTEVEFTSAPSVSSVFENVYEAKS